MKTVKQYLFIAVALIAMISFSSCESDEEIGFDLSGVDGVRWYGDMGASDYDGYPLESYITFRSGSRPDHGVGTEEIYYAVPPYEHYGTYKFDWIIENGRLYIDYNNGESIVINYPRISGRYFYGTIGNFEFQLEYDGGRSARKQ